MMRWVAIAVVPLAFALQGCSPDPAEASVAVRPHTTILARGVVDVDGGLLAVRSRRTGQLAEVAVALGQDVTRGTVLAKLIDDSGQTDADVARAAVQSARAELANARSRRALLRDQVQRVREAVSLGAENGRALDELQIQLDAVNGAVPVSQAALHAAEARLRASIRVADNTLVRAPADGRIVQINARGGDVAAATEGAPLFLLRPHGVLIVRATLPERDASRVRVGSAVSIESVDDDRQRIPGRVRSLGELARKPDASLATDDFSSDRVVDCIIELDAGPMLRIGSLVMARFSP